MTLIGIIALMGGSCYDLSAGLARGSAIIAIGVVVAAGTVVGQQPQLQPPTLELQQNQRGLQQVDSRSAM